MVFDHSNLRAMLDPLLGPAAARAAHARALTRRPTIGKALEIIRARWPEARSRSRAAPIFILSAGWRSGSTFLQRAIMAPGRVVIWGEPYRRAELVDSLARQLTAFTNQWPADDYFVDRFNTRGFESQWTANLYPPLADFVSAHAAFFERAFAKPAARLGFARWGFKEIVLGIDHARYLRWLFPEARIVFLYRNPYDAYRSYRRWRNFYERWPAEPVFTPARYGLMWQRLTRAFVEHSEEVNGLLLRYEELKTAMTRKRLADYLDCPVGDPQTIRRIGGSASGQSYLPKSETLLLKRRVEPLASDLRYLGPSR